METMTPQMADQRARNYFNKRLGALRTERASWIPQCKEISDNIQPVRGRYFLTDHNQGQARHNLIIDNTGTRALNTMAAGLMAGMTSPARPWFRLAVADPEAMEYAPVKVWLAEVTRIMRGIFARSNIYRALHAQYEELGAFGTSASIIDDDYGKIIRGHTLTCGEYMIAQNEKQQVDTLYREFEMQVGQIVAKFGLKNCSVAIQNAYSHGHYDQWRPVVHAVEPRTHRDKTKRDSKNMPYRSVYFESGNREHEFLGESGYHEFRILAPRWTVVGGDTYGWGPGMQALGDVKQLQRSQLMKGKAIDYQADPPIQIPSGMKNTGDVDILPGGSSYYNEMAGPSGGIKTAFDVNLRLDHLLADINDTRDRVRSAFFVDIFLMISQMDATVTATEIIARQEEKLLMLGPVLERLHTELLDPLIDVTFNRALRTGILPPAPQELEGMDLKVEYVSMLAQAQRAIGTNAIDRVIGTVGNVAAIGRTDALDKLDVDELIDTYSDMLGVDPDLINANEDVAIIRKQRAEQQQQQAQLEAAPGAAQAAKTMSEIDPGQVQQATSQFSGI